VPSTPAYPLCANDREAWPLEIRPFRQVYGFEPTAIRIGRPDISAWSHLAPRRLRQRQESLRGTTVEQVARIFTAGGGRVICAMESAWSKGEWHTRYPCLRSAATMAVGPARS